MALLELRGFLFAQNNARFWARVTGVTAVIKPWGGSIAIMAGMSDLRLPLWFLYDRQPNVAPRHPPCGGICETLAFSSAKKLIDWNRARKTSPAYPVSATPSQRAARTNSL